MKNAKLLQILVAAGCVGATVVMTPAFAGDSVTLGAGGGSNAFTVQFMGKSGNTWTYSVSQTGRALSHWSLGIESCEGKVSNPSPSSGFESGAGGASDSLLKNTGVDWMIKWNTGAGVSATGTLFSITLDGNYESTDVGVLVKTGGSPQSAVGSVTGPDCTKEVVTVVDTDSDGIADSADNCPAIANANQANADGDSMGDACDALTDSDGDTVADTSDNCPNAANMDQANVDGDGQGDACDATDDRVVDTGNDDGGDENANNGGGNENANNGGGNNDNGNAQGNNPNMLCSEITAGNGGQMNLVTKFNWTSGGYTREGGTDAITITGDANGGTWSVKDAGIVDIDAIIVKGATGTYVYNFEPGAKTAGEFSKMVLPLNGGEQVPDISNIQFCEDGVMNGGDEVCLALGGQKSCVTIPAGTPYTISVDDASYDLIAE